MNKLEEIVARTRDEVARRRSENPLDDLGELPARREFKEALRGEGLSLIAEHKRRSPSAGVIRADLSLEEVVCAYERGGASALSVLTEGPSFGGSLDDLRGARDAVGLPVLRKDFIVEDYQLREALVAGADAVLLIVAALEPARLRHLQAEAGELGLATLVEVHDEHELEQALSSGAQTVGINNRDLKTLQVDVRRTYELLPLVPPRVTVVAESGFSRREQLDELSAAGVDGVLIGEALMRAGDIEAACRMLSGKLIRR